MQKFLQNRIFGPNFSSFRLWEVSRAPKWFGRHQKLFTRALEPLWCGPKKFRPPHPKKVDFGGAEISTKPNLTISGPKKIFWPFFWVGRGSFIGWLGASWVASFGQKCIIMRSKGLGALSIKFGGHLSKFEEWPNSSNFDKLTVDSILKKVIFKCPNSWLIKIWA